MPGAGAAPRRGGSGIDTAGMLHEPGGVIPVQHACTGLDAPRLPSAPMRIAMVTSECEPFAKTGGLADVVDALSRALGELGHEVDVYLPRYRGLEPPPGSPTAVRSACRSDPAGRALDDGDWRRSTLWTGRRTAIGCGWWTIRPASTAPSYYGDAGGDYPDNGARFTLLGRAALEAMRAEAEPVDVLHGHDWEAGPGAAPVAATRSRRARELARARRRC